MVYGILACCVEENYRHNVRKSLNSMKKNFEIQKLINAYYKSFKCNVGEIIEQLSYYYKPYIHNEYNKYAPTEIYDSKLDYEIRNFKPVNDFYICNTMKWNLVSRHIFSRFSQDLFKYCDLEPCLTNFNNLIDDFKITINKIEKIIDTLRDILIGINEDTDFDNMCANLSILSDKNIHSRNNLEYTLNNGIESKTFKIFKNPVGDRKPAINPKPYYEMKQYIKEYVLRKKKEIVDLMEENF